ncbi:MAG TPA: hypothetical protein VF698_08130 [Thermoanaerobaculia bacterium]
MELFNGGVLLERSRRITPEGRVAAENFLSVGFEINVPTSWIGKGARAIFGK